MINEHKEIMKEVVLTAEQRLYLQRIFDYLCERSQWPTYRELDQWFTCYHADLDIEAIWKSLPQGLTNYMDLNRPYESRATLTVPTISLLQNNGHVLSSFLEVIKVCVDVYLRSSTEEISSKKLLQDNLHWLDIGVYQAGLLLQVEPNIYSSFTGPDQSRHWQCNLARGIRRFRGITTIEEYLEKRNPPRKKVSIPSISEPVNTDTSITAECTLHPDIHEKCWGLYKQGDYDNAILNATKALEVAVRKKSNLSANVVGADLIAQAFRSDKPILNYSTVKPEQERMMSLLRGIIMVYKNPQSHRFVGIQDQSKCLGIILMCSNALYAIDNISVSQGTPI